MRAWSLLLGGLAVWTAHFFGLYAIVSVMLDSAASRIAALVLTVACLAVDMVLLRMAVNRLRMGADEFGRWVGWTGAVAAALSAVAVLWQGLPALLG